MPLRPAGATAVRRLSALSAGLLLLTLTACAVAPQPQSQPTPQPPAAPAPPPGQVTFEAVVAGPVSLHQTSGPALAVAGDEAAFRKLWQERISVGPPDPALQKLDFSRDLAVVAFQGRYPTGGYGIKVERVETQGGKLSLVADTRMPAPGAMLPQVITSPYEAIAIRKADLPGWDKLHYVLTNKAGSTLAETDP